jgi:DNA-binding CsgD family transcriptional regulator
VKTHVKQPLTSPPSPQGARQEQRYLARRCLDSYACWVHLSWPLTGRAEELRLIKRALCGSDASGMVVSGAAGVGKSRIVREGLAAAASTGCETRWAVGTSSARAVPLGAFAAWVGSAVADTLQVVRGVIESLTCASPGTMVVVGVDDAHLLDDLSIFVLHQIVLRRAARVLLTIRDGEPLPPGLQEIWTGGLFERLVVQPLSRDETTTLVSATLGGSLDPDAAHRLWALTRGNALYVVNIVEQEIGAGRLARQHGYWRWIGEPVVSAGLVEQIESRIGDLPAFVGDVVDMLAVGEPLDLALLSKITGLAAVEDAEMRGLITVEHTNGAAARLAHPLYGEVRRERTASVRLRRLRGLVAAQLAASDDRDDPRVVVRRAVLSVDSDLQPDPDLLVRAARCAVGLADLTLADRLADAAIRAGAGTDARIVRAHALTWLSRGPEMEALLANSPPSEMTAADQAHVALLRANNMYWTLANPEAAKELMDGVSQTIPASARGCVDAFFAVYWAAMGRPEAARKSAQHLDLDQLPGHAGAEAAWGIALAAGDAGRTNEAVAAADAGCTIAAREFDAAAMRFILTDIHVGALLQSGRIDQALEVAERLRQEAADLPGSAQLMSTAVAGRAALGAGRLATACSLLGRVVEQFSAAGDTIGLGYRYQHSHAITLALLGESVKAAAALAALHERAHPSFRFMDFERALAQAWVAAGQGAVTEAVATLLSMAESTRSHGRFACEVACLQAACQLGDHSSAARLRELAAIVEGPRAGVAARFAAGLRDGDGGALAAVSEEFERMGDGAAAADAAAHAAITYRRQDLRGSAYGCSARAAALAEQCGGACTPALLQAAERLPLRAREREIAMLIGVGLSNRAIAARLTVSVRTVEGHIYRAMAKTGVGSREELAALVRRHKPVVDE